MKRWWLWLWAGLVGVILAVWVSISSHDYQVITIDEPVRLTHTGESFDIVGARYASSRFEAGDRFILAERVDGGAWHVGCVDGSIPVVANGDRDLLVVCPGYNP